MILAFSAPVFAADAMTKDQVKTERDRIAAELKANKAKLFTSVMEGTEIKRAGFSAAEIAEQLRPRRATEVDGRTVGLPRAGQLDAP